MSYIDIHETTLLWAFFAVGSLAQAVASYVAGNTVLAGVLSLNALIVVVDMLLVRYTEKKYVIDRMFDAETVDEWEEDLYNG